MAKYKEVKITGVVMEKKGERDGRKDIRWIKRNKRIAPWY